MINDLYRENVTQYEKHNIPSNAPQADMIPRDAESQLRRSLEDALHREESLKRRVDELEHELADLRDEQPSSKRMRLPEGPEYPEPPHHF